MDYLINNQDMNWLALGPELIVLATALFILMLGLSKTFNDNVYLSKASMIGVVMALLFSVLLWGIAPTASSKNPVTDMFSGALVNDRFSQSFNMIFLLMSLFTIFASVRYPRQESKNKAEFFTLLLMSVAGMMFLAKSVNLITVFVSLELFSISLYILCGFSAKHETGLDTSGNTQELSWECQASQEATVKYLLTGAFASAILAYGMALIYAGTGTLDIRMLGHQLQSNPYSHNTLVYIGIGLMFAGLAFKISAVPFHAWTPDVYQGAPTSITGFMSVATKAAAFAVIARVFYIALPDIQTIWTPILFTVSVVTMLVGNIAAIFQNDIKRMLAYSGVAHAGYLLIGIIANTQDGIASLLFYLGVYLFMNIGAFAVVFITEGEGRDGNSIYRFKGLSKRNPLLAAAMSLFMLSLAGFPPTAGFFAKFYVFVSAIKHDNTLIAVLAVVASIISVYFYLRVIAMMYFHEGGTQESLVISRGMGAIVTISCIAIIVVGFAPSCLMKLALDSIPF
jgi:NADH-quinone oxidoreductase subunit N